MTAASGARQATVGRRGRRARRAAHLHHDPAQRLVVGGHVEEDARQTHLVGEFAEDDRRETEPDDTSCRARTAEQCAGAPANQRQGHVCRMRRRESRARSAVGVRRAGAAGSGGGSGTVRAAFRGGRRGGARRRRDRFGRGKLVS